MIIDNPHFLGFHSQQKQPDPEVKVDATDDDQGDQDNETPPDTDDNKNPPEEEQTTPPETVFKKLAPSEQRYTLLRDEL